MLQMISNAEALDWMGAHIPRVALCNPMLEQTYYFRWWTFRKHIKSTPEGCVISEFHPDVSCQYNTIPCACGRHIEEGRWLRDCSVPADYIAFWYRSGSQVRKYGNWLEADIGELCCVRGNADLGQKHLNAMIRNYEA